MPNDTILVLQKNSNDTYVVGDIHGELEIFNKIVANLKQNDTLVIVGDLIDRGMDPKTNIPTTPDILDFIINNQNNPQKKINIYSVAGNHEINFVRAMNIFLNKPNWNRNDINELLILIINGGRWIFDPLDNENIQDVLLHYETFRGKSANSHEISPFQDTIVDYFNMIKESPNKTIYFHPKIGEYIEFIESLPLIIKIDADNNPAWVVHADLPYSDKNLENMISKKLKFNLLAKLYITETREDIYQDNNRGKESNTITYCGHNIIRDSVIPVRENSLHVNLDFGMYYTHQAILVNHTKGLKKGITREEFELDEDEHNQDEEYIELLIATNSINEFLIKHRSIHDNNCSISKMNNTLFGTPSAGKNPSIPCSQNLAESQNKLK